MSSSLQLQWQPETQHYVFATDLLNQQVGSPPTTVTFLREAYSVSNAAFPRGVFCCFVDDSDVPFGFARIRDRLPFLAADAKQILILMKPGSESRLTPLLFKELLTFYDVQNHQNLIVEVRHQNLVEVVLSSGFKIGTRKYLMKRILNPSEPDACLPASFSGKVKIVRRPDDLLLQELHLCEQAFVRDIPFALPILSAPSFDDYKKLFFNERNVFFVAYDSKKHMVGYSCLTTAETERAANFSTTGVLATHRKLGVAKAIKVTALNWCRKEGLCHVTSQNHSRNEGIVSLNRSLGFEIEDTRFEMIPATS